MIRALIFDFDGLMVDTESPAYESWLEIYREYNCEFPFARWSTVLGGSGAEFDPCAYLAEQTGQVLDHDALRARRWQRKLDLTAIQPLLPGVMTYVHEAKRLGLKVAVASSSSRKWVVGHLDRLAFSDQFDTIICADDVTHVKPAPDIYLAAVAALKVQPQDTIAFEDAPNGLLAAKRAGVFSVAVPNPLTGQLPLDHADMRLTSLEEIRLQTLLATVEQRLQERV